MGVWAMSIFQLDCRGRYGRRGVPAERLKDEALGDIGVAGLPVFVLSLEEQFLIGNRHDLYDTREGGGSYEGFVKQVLAIRQWHERLGMRLARYGPEPTANAAGHDYGY